MQYKDIAGNPKELSERIDEPYSTVCTWFTGKYYPLSKNIQKILTEYKLEPEKLGVESIEINILGNRLHELFEENKPGKQKDYVEFLNQHELYITESTLSKWLNGTMTPNMSNLIDLSNIFGVDYLYLLGLIDERRISDDIIKKRTKLKDTALGVILKLNYMKKYGEKWHKDNKEQYGFDYEEILSYIISDEQFFDMFYYEANTVLAYYTGENFKNSFDELINEIDIDLTGKELGISESDEIVTTIPASAPYTKKIETFSKAVLQKKIGIMFDEFIEQVMSNRNIKEFTDYELRRRERELLEQNKKINEELEKINKLKKKNNDK